MSLFQEHLTAGLSLRRSVAGERVTYQRGETTIENVSAVIGSTPFRIDNDLARHTASQIVRSVDFLIGVDALAELDSPSHPQRGDRIVRASGEQYDVLPINGEPEWRFVDAAQTEYRIHTKRVG